MDDYFFLEPLIVQRLIERLGNLVDGIYSRRNLAALLEGRVETPAVYVLYDREVVPSGHDLRSGSQQVVDQHWQLVLADRSYGDILDGGRDEAGPLLARINQALQGWQPPADQVFPLRKISSPGTTYDDSGLSLFSLTYACRVVMTGQP